MAEGELGKPYAANFTVGDGEEPYMWELVDGPGWMELSASGELSAAMVETAGEHVVTVRVVDQAGRSGETDVLEIATRQAVKTTPPSPTSNVSHSSLAAATPGSRPRLGGRRPVRLERCQLHRLRGGIIRISSGSGFPDLTVTAPAARTTAPTHARYLAISSQDQPARCPQSSENSQHSHR